MILIAIAWKLVVRPDPGPSPPRFSAQLSWCLLGLVLHPSSAPFLANVWHHQWTSVHAGHSTKTPSVARDGGQAYIKSIFYGYLTFKCSQRFKTSYSKGYSIVKGKKLCLTSCETWGTFVACYVKPSNFPVDTVKSYRVKVTTAVTTAAILRCLYPVINGPPDQHWQSWCWHVQPSNSSTEISPSPSSIIWNLQKWLHCHHCLRCSPCPIKFQD